LRIHLNSLEQGLFENTDEKDLLGVEYHINFSWTTMPGYFDKDCLPDWFKEMGVPDFVAPILSRIYALKEELSGKRDLTEVAQGILRLCQQINPNHISILDYAGQAGDIFSYRNHLFYKIVGRIPTNLFVG